MWECVRVVGWSVVSALMSQRELAPENVELRHQLMVLQRQPAKEALKKAPERQPHERRGSQGT